MQRCCICIYFSLNQFQKYFKKYLVVLGNYSIKLPKMYDQLHQQSYHVSKIYRIMRALISCCSDYSAHSPEILRSPSFPLC